MVSALRHWHLREWRFVGLVTATLLCIGLYLTGGAGQLGREGSGWRRIDLEALQRRMEAGELSGHEALWYHSTQGQGRGPVDHGRGDL